MVKRQNPLTDGLLQGGALVRAIIASPSASDFTIYAINRDPTSASAQKLAALSPSIKPTKGDLANPAALFSTIGEPIWGVFCMGTSQGGHGASAATEEQYGKAMVDAAIANNVSHFVYTSVDRGGETKSPETPTNIPHFICKHNVEKYLESKAGTGNMTYTILRPVAFFDNFTNDFMGKAFMSTWKLSVSDTKPLQFIAASDIGWFAAQAFINPEDVTYKNKALSLAGDDLTFPQWRKVFKEHTGKEVPTTFSLVGRLILFMVGDFG
jgi:uncharacterized protein YbjT (DUF2867 family)